VLAWTGLGLACLALGAYVKLPEAIETPGTDTGLYATYGRLLLQGARPYVDFWDIHPPLVFAYWALVDALTGPDWLRTCFTINGLVPQSCTGSLAHAGDLLLSVVAALVTARIARQAGGSRVAMTLAAVSVVGFADQVLLSDEGSNPSKLTLLPSVVALWAYLRSLTAERGRHWAAVAGVAAAIAGLAKQPALLTLAALVIHAARQRDAARTRALLAGSGGAFLVVCTTFAVLGSLDGFLDQVWAYNVERSFAGYFVHPVKEPGITLGRVVTEGAGLLAVWGLAGAAILAIRPHHANQRLLASWSVINALAVLAFREFVYVVPSLAVVGAFAVDRAWRWANRWGTLHAVLGACLLGAVGLVTIRSTTPFQQVQMARARGERGPGGGLSQPEELGRILRRDVAPGALFVYGNAAELYPLAERVPAAPYLNAEALRASAPQAARARAELVATLERTHPPVIVLAPHDDEPELDLAAYPALRWFLQGCYRRQPINAVFDRSWTVLVSTRDCGRLARS